jgi:hypothetical protein
MALTAGFKKFIGLVAVVALVGGGIYAYKQMPKSAEVVVDTADVKVPAQTEDGASSPQPYTSPIKQAEVANTVVDDAVAEPEPKPKKENTSANRGLDAVLNAGKK